MLTSKERILKKVRKALINPTPNPFPLIDFEKDIYLKEQESLDVLFATEFNKVNGQFIYCENKKDFASNVVALINDKEYKNVACFDPQLQEMLTQNQFSFITNNTETADAAITMCESLVARTGSIVVSSKQIEGRSLTIIPPVHIVVASYDQFVYSIKDAIEVLTKKYAPKFPSAISLINGPSRTADIEKTLVLGAHGPKEVYLFLIDQL